MCMPRLPPTPTHFPYTTLFRSGRQAVIVDVDAFALQNAYEANYGHTPGEVTVLLNAGASAININILQGGQDRKSTRLNSSHSQTSYVVFCLTKKTGASRLSARA